MRFLLPFFLFLCVLCNQSPLLGQPADGAVNPIDQAIKEGSWIRLGDITEGAPEVYYHYASDWLAAHPDADVETTIRVRFVVVSGAMFTGRTEEALEVGAKALSDAEQLGDPYLIGRAHYALGTAYFLSHDMEKTEAETLEAVKWIDQISDKDSEDFILLTAGCYTLLGNVSLLRADSAQAVEYYLDALRTIENTPYNQRSFKIRTNLASAYMQTGKLDEAMSLYDEALKTARELGEPNTIMTLTSNLGSLAASQGQLDKAIAYYTEALEMARKQGNQQAILTLMVNITDYYIRAEDWKDARRYADETAKLADESTHTLLRAIAKVNLGLVSLNEGKMTEALDLFEQAEKVMIEQDAEYQLAEILETMAKALEQAGNYPEALAHYKRFKEVSDKINAADAQERVQKLQSQYDKDKQDYEIAELQRANDQKRFDLERERMKAQLQDERLKRDTALRRAMSGVLAFAIICLAIVIYRYRHEIRARRELSRLNDALSERERSLSAANTDLKRAIQEKDDVLGVVAHDLKNPIGGILGLSTIIEEDEESGIGPQNRLMIQQIRETAERMFGTVTELLDQYRMQAGASYPAQGRVEVTKIAAEAIEAWQQRASAKRQSLTLSANSQRSVHASGQILFQALDNLISNAVKYSPYGAPIFVSVEDCNGSVCISVRDEGPGIPKDEQDLLFRKFARLSNRPTGGEHSSGIGLSIVKSHIEAMGGTVSCDSEAGKGSTFRIELPASES